MVLEGDALTLETVLWQLKADIPCVVVNGSGGIADILGFAIANASWNRESGQYFLAPIYMEELLNIAEEGRIKSFTSQSIPTVMNCIQFTKIIRIFDIDE